MILVMESGAHTTGAGPEPGARAANRRQEILAAALALFNESGFARTTIQDIAIRAEASVGSIYHHFGDKESIAVALYVEGMGDYQTGFLRQFEVHRGGAEAGVKAIVTNHLRWVAAHTEHARFLLTTRDPTVSAASDSALRQMNQHVFNLSQLWIDRWVEAGEIRPMPFALFHAVVLGPSQEFARHWLAGRVKETIDEAESALAEAAWRAVRA